MLRQGNQSLSLPSKFGFITQFTNKLTQCLLTDYVSRSQPNLCDTKKIQWQQATDTNKQKYTQQHTHRHTRAHNHTTKKTHTKTHTHTHTHTLTHPHAHPYTQTHTRPTFIFRISD